MEIEKVNILGVGVSSVTFAEAVEAIKGFVGDGQRHYVVTVNPEFVVTAQEDTEFKKILNHASLAVCDGIGVLWASKVLGSPLKQKITGTDLTGALCDAASKKDYKIFLLGAEEGVADTAAEVLRTKFKGLEILGSLSGSPRVEDDAKTVRQINNLIGGRRIDVLFVAYGHPKQEKWLARNLPQLNVGVGIGVGGAFDYISGRSRRAPRLIRSLGLE
ncbi:WecB/TagA/CpsF family glycosyltransferase, partial [Candidatus Parcubacteria bacterium]|nr:WecB/TagA/CpsF family glycosyltransferase [Candidatus Parcubacteria bacterium]